MDLTYAKTGVKLISKKPKRPRTALEFYIDDCRIKADRKKHNRCIQIFSSSPSAPSTSPSTSCTTSPNTKNKKCKTRSIFTQNKQMFVRRCRAKFLKLSRDEQKPYVKQEQEDNKRWSWENSVFASWDAKLKDALTCNAPDAPAMPKSALEYFAEDNARKERSKWLSQSSKQFKPPTQLQSIETLWELLPDDGSEGKEKYLRMEQEGLRRVLKEIEEYPTRKNTEAIDKWVEASKKYRHRMDWVTETAVGVFGNSGNAPRTNFYKHNISLVGLPNLAPKARTTKIGHTRLTATFKGTVTNIRKLVGLPNLRVVPKTQTKTEKMEIDEDDDMDDVTEVLTVVISD